MKTNKYIISTSVIILLFITTLAYAKTAEDYLKAGNTKYELKDYKGAIKYYNKAIELNPDLAEAYYNRGIAKIRLGQKDDGCFDFSEASELGLSGAIKENCN